jgi:hypothetical protein
MRALRNEAGIVDEADRTEARRYRLAEQNADASRRALERSELAVKALQPVGRTPTWENVVAAELQQLAARDRERERPCER